MNCNNCGAPLEEGAQFCASCGAKVETVVETVEVTPVVETYSAAPEQPVYNAGPSTTYTAPQSSAPVNDINVNSTPFLIWSIANMVLCCLPLGIVGLVMTLKAGKATSQYEAEDALKKAKLWNIIGSVSGVVVVVLYIIIMVLSISSSGY